MLNKQRRSGGRRSNKCKGQKNGLQLHLTPDVNFETGKYRILTVFTISNSANILQGRFFSSHFVPVTEIDLQKPRSDALNREEINKIGTATAELSLSSFLAGTSTSESKSPAELPAGELVCCCFFVVVLMIR